MREYLVSVTVVSALLGLINYLSYPGASEKATRFAVSVLLIYTTVLPILTFVSSMSATDAMPDLIDRIKEEAEKKPSGEREEYLEVSEEAIKKGISKVLFTEYGIAEENVQIYLEEFDFESMRSKKIKLTLSGGGALSDYRRIEEYINSFGIGKCEVNIEFG